MSEELLPCPWCKGKSLSTHGSSRAYIKCEGCGARGPEAFVIRPDHTAFSAWQARTPDPALALREALMQTIIDLEFLEPCLKGVDEKLRQNINRTLDKARAALRGKG